MIKIVFTDVDGTLLDGIRNVPTLSTKNQYAIKALLSKGIYVVISSGRSMSILNNEIINLNPSAYILCNGSYVKLNEKIIKKVLFNKNDIKYLEELTLVNNGILLYENQKGVYSKINSPLLDEFVKEWNMPNFKIKYQNDFNDEVYKVTTIFSNIKDFNNFTSSLDNRVDYRKQMGLLAYDIAPKDISKGEAIKLVLDTLNISYKDALAFGDNVNDIEMLKVVGKGIAMSNACIELKEIADDIADDAINDGFYKYLVDHQIIKSS